MKTSDYKKYRMLNKIRSIPIWVVRIIVLPIKVLLSPLVIIAGFFLTDWEDDFERRFYWKMVRYSFVV